MTSKKKNPQLCTTAESLTKGLRSLYRISGLFEGKARVCTLVQLTQTKFQAITCTGKPTKKIFGIKSVEDGRINIMCIERGE